MPVLLPDSIERKGIASLPVEILGSCFLFLPPRLLERVPILHVCRTWRTIAFHYPGVWTPLRLHDAPRQIHLLVDLVLSRTRYYPIDLHYISFSYHWASSSSDMWNVVGKHLDRMRAIYWCADHPDTSRLLHPALLLEEISGWLMDEIPSNFLGGVPGKLRRLHLGTLRLPEICPALSTVTDLKFGIGFEPEDSNYLGRLFELFPCLESLDLEVHVHDAALLPPGPAPRTLTHLRLNTTDERYDNSDDINRLDLIGLCQTWHIFPRIKSVELYSFVLDEMDFAPILNGVVELYASHNGDGSKLSRIIAYHSDDQEYTLELRSRTPTDRQKIVEFLVADPQCLSRLRWMRMTSDMLSQFARAVGPLPLLTELSVIVHPESIIQLAQSSDGEDVFDYRQVFPWSHLHHLPTAPLLRTLEVSVRSDHIPTAADAKTLILTLGMCPVAFDGRVTVRIKGFPAEAVIRVDEPSASRQCSIAFE